VSRTTGVAVVSGDDVVREGTKKARVPMRLIVPRRDRMLLRWVTCVEGEPNVSGHSLKSAFNLFVKVFYF